MSSHLVIAVSTADLGQIAPRPLRAGLVSGKVQDVLGRPMLDYFEGLRRMAMTGDRASALQLTR